MARCPNCNGVGEIQVRTDTRFYRDVPCPSCDDGDVEWGKRRWIRCDHCDGSGGAGG